MCQRVAHPPAPPEQQRVRRGGPQLGRPVLERGQVLALAREERGAREERHDDREPAHRLEPLERQHARAALPPGGVRERDQHRQRRDDVPAEPEPARAWTAAEEHEHHAFHAPHQAQVLVANEALQSGAEEDDGRPGERTPQVALRAARVHAERGEGRSGAPGTGGLATSHAQREKISPAGAPATTARSIARTRPAWPTSFGSGASPSPVKSPASDSVTPELHAPPGYVSRQTSAVSASADRSSALQPDRAASANTSTSTAAT